jgi:hypothetical protein
MMTRSHVPAAILASAAILTLAGCSVDAPVGVTSPVGAEPSLSISAAAATIAPLLQTTLDDINAVRKPKFGIGTHATIATFPANNFVPAHRGGGLMANASGERVQYPQVENGIQNVELDQGTMDFWYQPNYDSNKNVKYTIAGTGSWHHPVPNGLHFGKHNASNQNQLFLLYFDPNGTRQEHNVSAAKYSWKAGTWQHIVITWDFTVAPGVQNLHIYLNNVDLPLTGTVTRGPRAFPAESPNEFVYIGARDPNGSIIANGMYDQFRIFGRARRPS